MRICEVCGARYKGSPTQCPLDGGRLRELPDPLLGRTIAGRYLVLEKVGAGGMGTVYRARDESAKHDVALKFLLPELAVDITNRQRFLREAKAANRIDHENIIDVADFGETDDGQVYLVMEFLQGIALAEEVGRGALGVVRSVDVAMQCASALARAHELDVVHRDIKPENIYLVAATGGGGLERRDFVKILDFGLAQMKGELRLTASGAVFGTPEYMAPEQARGAPLTGLADLYALGCVVFECLTGTPPFSGSTPDLILKHMREQAPLPSSRASNVPPDLDQLVKKLLEKDPQKRHRDGYHLLEDLRRIADRLPMAKPSTIPVSRGSMLEREKGRRDEKVSLPADSTGPILPEAWEQRVALFRQLVPRAYPAQPPPGWLLPAIDDLSARIAAVRALEGDLAKATDQSAEREGNGRNVRLRLGRAIDELGRDESRALRRLEEIGAEMGEARRRMMDREVAIKAAIQDVRTLPERVLPEVVLRLRDAGEVAAKWLEAEAKIKSLVREIEVRERERDDLRFQIAQLKGRMATLAAEQDLDLGEMRERAARLGRERDAAIDDLQERAMAILRHFAEFPQLADAVRTASMSAQGRAGARISPSGR